MSHFKTKLLFRVFHYLTLYVVIFNFIVYPAYAMVEHFPYGLSSRYALPYPGLYIDGYENESQNAATAKEEASEEEQSRSKTTGRVAVRSHAATMAVVEYQAPEKSGRIGNSSDGFDDPFDNIFTLEVNKAQLQGKELVLQYDVYGIENASGVSKSFNEHTATGGTVIKRNEEWKTVEEPVSAEQFKNGTNHLLFTSFDNTNYGIRNLKLRVLSGKTTAGITLVDGTTMYLQNGRGYLKGVSSFSNADLYLQGKLVKTQNGVFETVIPDADKLDQIDYVLLDKSGNTLSSGALPIYNKTEVTLLNDAKSAFGKTFSTHLGNEEFAIDTENVSFHISKKNYEKADKISVQQLRAIDMAPLGTNIINVTASKSGYRFLPDGAKFNEDALVGIKYDTAYLPKGYTPEDVKVLYFDMDQRRWLSIATDTIVKEQSKIVANTTHFTDYIAGVIQAPESPETSSFTPTSISDIQVANPTANIVQIQPPTANQQGDGAVDFPITLPPARAGLQPNLSVSYNNNGSGGIVGQGWDISIPTISVDTRFGIPTYDPNYETESYLLNGEELMLSNTLMGAGYLPHRSDAQRARVTDAVFFPKVESSFSRVIRKGTGPSNYYWEVWDKSGTKYIYGDIVANNANPYSAVLKSSLTDSNAKRAKWYLSSVTDKNSNTITYIYQNKEVPASGVFKDGMEVYIKKIMYNYNHDHIASGSEEKRGYSVFFRYKSTPRGDAQTNYRYGFKENSSMLLDKIKVSCIELTDNPNHIPNPDKEGTEWNGTILPCENEIEYQFTYDTQAAFAKTLLTKITTKNIKINMSTGLPAETQEYDHQFQYYNDIAGGLFKSPESIFVDKDFSGDKHAVLSSTVEDFTSSDFGFSAGVSLPSNPPVWWPFSNSGTINLSFPSATSTSSGPTMLLMDIDGDGLDDKVMKIGNQIKYRKNLAGISFSKQLYTAYNISDLGLSENNTKTDPELSFSLLFLNLTSSKSQSNSRSRIYFTDVNNDGLVDYVKDRIVYFNRIDPNSGMPTFTDNSNLTPNVILRDGQVDPTVSQGLPNFVVDSGLMDAVKVWVAPKAGNVNITGSITKPFVASHNGVRFSVEHGTSSAPLSTYLINPSLLVSGTLATNVSNRSVNAGDHIYFRVNTSQLPDGEVTVNWNPSVVYTNGTDGSNFNDSFLFGDVVAEPAIIKEPGQYQIEWTPGSVNLPTGVELKVTAYKLNPSNLNSPRTNVLTYTQTVTSYLNYQPASLSINANNSVYANNPDSYIYVEIEAKGSAALNWKLFDDAFIPKLKKTNDNSFVHIVPKYDTGNTVATELGIGTLYKNWGQFAYKGALPDQDFTPIKKELVSKAKLAGVANYSSATANQLMNNQSSSVSYNFTTGTFSGGGTNFTVSAAQKEAMENFTMLRSDRAKLAWSAHPRLLVKGLAMNPNYRYDNSNYKPMVPVPAPTGVGTYGAYAIVKENTSISQSSNWNVSFYGFGLGNGENRSTSRPINDYMDLNGDGYPDVVGDKIQFTSNKGGLTNNFLNKSLMAASVSNGSGKSAGGASAHVTQIADTRGRFSRIRIGNSSSFTPNISGGANKFETVTAADHILLDINGDGLADVVKPQGQVEFNTASNFVAGTWTGYDKPNVSKTTSVSLSGSVGAGFSDFAGTFPNNFAGNFLSQSNLDLSFGVNGSRSSTQREKDFVDINGDGLPDFISGNTVKINNGTAFSSTSYSLDRMSESTSFSIGTSLNGSVLIPILIPFLGVVIKVGGGGGTSFGKSYNEDNVSLRDFNGDGYPDIVETVSEHEIKVQYSKIGRTNMLKKIINPTGSTIELNYDTKNKISGTTIGSTYKMPFKKWVLTGVKVNDGFIGDGENVQEYAFEYNNGFKDRRERKFLGFGEVKTQQLNSSGNVYRTVVQEYVLNEMPNQHIYLPGSSSDSRKYHYIGKLPKRTATFDGQNRLLNQVQQYYAIFQRPLFIIGDGSFDTTLPVAIFTYADNTSIIPLLYSVMNTTYHYSAVGTGAIANEVVSRFKKYDRYGNVTKFDEEINSQLTNSVDITYHNLNTASRYDVSTPASHKLNNYQRYSTTTLDTKGNVNQINRYKDYGSSGSQVSTTDYQFDLFGNLTRVTLPKPLASSSNAQRMYFNFTYDNLFHKNVIRINDAQGYQSETTYNHFGLVTKQKDMNNVEIINEYDPTLRLIKVKGPYNSQWTIKNEYKVHPTTRRYYAVTKHNIKDESAGSGELILHTSSFADGLGRIIQTKKELNLAQACGQTTAGYRFAVSGIQVYDEFGRVVESDLSQEQLSCSGTFASGLENYTALVRDPLLKTSMVYDMQDRVLQSHMHGLNASTLYEYGYESDHNGIPRAYEKVTLPQGNISQTFKDAKGQVVLTKQIDDLNSVQLLTKYTYNTIGELQQVTDADNKTTVYQYDTFGQKTQVTHPDNGISKFEYDLAGKLVASTNQNLLNQNSSARIQYKYVLNQLQSVSYPDMVSNGLNIPASTVNYIYGANGAANYSAGRIVAISDLTGTQSFEYGKLGEVVKEDRKLESAVGNMQFTTLYNYDTWGRMLNMTYPDGEVVTYNYNTTGQLVSIKNNSGDFYLKNVKYNFFDQPVEIVYGNDVKTVNTYDLTQRVRSMRLDRPDTTTFMHNVYDYDKNQNIVKIVNGSSQHALLKMGGVSTKSYTYDRFNRLASATGVWSGGNSESHNYSLNLAYNNTHGIVSKNQHHNVQSPSFNGLSNNTYNAKYEYGDTAHPHAVSTIRYTGLSGNQTAVSRFTYDATGNLVNYNTNQGSFTNRNMVWDQQNRLLAVVDDNTKVSHYIYDHAGERTFKSVGAITQVNIGGAAIHEVLDFNNYVVYPSGYVVVDPGKDEYSKHYYINGKRFVSRLAKGTGIYMNTPLAKQAASEDGADALTGDTDAQMNLNSMLGVQNTVMGFSIGNTTQDCLTQIDNIVTAYQNLNNSTGGSVQNCFTDIKNIKSKIGTMVGGQTYTACQALMDINAYVCTPQRSNTPGSTPTPSFTTEELMQFDCLTELNILIGAYTAASDALDQQQFASMMLLNACSDDAKTDCCIRYQQTGVWECECQDLKKEDCKVVVNTPPTTEWLQCIKKCVRPGCFDLFIQNNYVWESGCFRDLINCTECNDVGVTPPDPKEVDCLLNCRVEGVRECVEMYLQNGVWTAECENISKECNCGDEGGEDEEMANCANDCANPMASECYQYYKENGVWKDGCAEVMVDCGCYDPNGELDCYKKALNYIRKNLSFEPNNACAVLAYVEANFKCSKEVIVRPDTPEYFPDLTLPTPNPGSNNNLPPKDGPYDEAKRKPIWWYHSDHLGSSTYLTDNFGRPTHYYETLPFGEMMVEHNQSANHPAGVGYSNKYKFNGKELDDATQMYYYGARYYDPRISIFVSVDPLAEKTMEPYQYVSNNPVNMVDPTGMEPVPSYYALNPWFSLKPWQWYSTAGVYDNRTFNSAAQYNTKNLRASAYQNVNQRNSYYGWVNDRVSSTGSKWFGAAKLVTSINALGGADVGSGTIMSKNVAGFLQRGNKFLFAHNMKNAKSLIDDGKLSGSFTNANGNKVSFDGKSGKALDYAMVEFEQTKVQDFIGSYRDIIGNKEMSNIIKGVNELFSGNISTFAPSEINDVMKEHFDGGKSFNFENYNDRVKLGQKLVDKLHE